MKLVSRMPGSALEFLYLESPCDLKMVGYDLFLVCNDQPLNGRGESRYMLGFISKGSASSIAVFGGGQELL